MQKIFKLTVSDAKKIAQRFGTPSLVISTEQIEYNYRYLTEMIPGIKVFYAVKSNPDVHIIGKLSEIGSCFDVASDGEMDMLHDYGVSAERMIYANPVKTWSGLHTARRLGVNKMTYDSDIEIDKIAGVVPGAQVLLRVRVDNPAALVDLNSKFGCYPEEALYLMRRARACGLDVAGLCFHVGSQTLSSAPYIQGILTCMRLLDVAALEGFNLRILDIGGGFPVPAVDAKYDIGAIFAQINTALKSKFPQLEIWCEPGRYICGTAVNLLTSVIANVIKNDKQWYFMDEGLYGSFSGKMFDHWQYMFEAAVDNRPWVRATFAGPSCDSLDVILSDIDTPQLELNDVLLFPVTGAYSMASASTFNGFRLAKTLCWEEINN